MLDVPFAMMMTLNTAQAGPLAPVLAEQRLTPTVIMALHLMNEKLNASSVHQPWLSALPTSFETPLSWSDEELHALNGSTVLSVIRRRKQPCGRTTSLFGLFARPCPIRRGVVHGASRALSTVYPAPRVQRRLQLVPVIVPFADLEHQRQLVLLARGQGRSSASPSALVRAGDGSTSRSGRSRTRSC